LAEEQLIKNTVISSSESICLMISAPGLDWFIHAFYRMLSLPQNPDLHSTTL